MIGNLIVVLVICGFLALFAAASKTRDRRLFTCLGVLFVMFEEARSTWWWWIIFALTSIVVVVLITADRRKREFKAFLATYWQLHAPPAVSNTDKKEIGS